MRSQVGHSIEVVKSLSGLEKLRGLERAIIENNCSKIYESTALVPLYTVLGGDQA